jgi:hypothetical protein
VIYNAGSAQLVGGTSCSSPIFASVVGLINDQLAAAGKSPLGTCCYVSGSGRGGLSRRRLAQPVDLREPAGVQRHHVRHQPGLQHQGAYTV